MTKCCKLDHLHGLKSVQCSWIKSFQENVVIKKLLIAQAEPQSVHCEAKVFDNVVI